MVKKCKIVPKFGVPDLLKLKRVEFPCTMDLNEAEIIRAMQYADLYEQLDDDSEVLLDPMNFNDIITSTTTSDDTDPDTEDTNTNDSTVDSGAENPDTNAETIDESNDSIDESATQ